MEILTNLPEAFIAYMRATPALAQMVAIIISVVGAAVTTVALGAVLNRYTNRAFDALLADTDPLYKDYVESSTAATATRKQTDGWNSSLSVAVKEKLLTQTAVMRNAKEDYFAAVKSAEGIRDRARVKISAIAFGFVLLSFGVLLHLTTSLFNVTISLY